MRLIFIFFLLLSTKSCNYTEKQSINNVETIEEAVYNILELCKADKINSLNEKYVNPDIGVYEKKKIGLVAEFLHTREIEKTTSSTGTIYQVLTNLDDIDINQKIDFYNDLEYNCDRFKWNKTGLIASKNFNIESNNNLNVIKEDSYMIVLTDNDIVFYLTKLKDRFYITIIDRTIADCSA